MFVFGSIFGKNRSEKGSLWLFGENAFLPVGSPETGGRSGISSATPKRFGRAVPLQIGGSPTRTPSPRRWGKQDGKGHFSFSPAAPKKFGRAARRVSPSSGRTLLEMLGVLAIVGILSIAALVGFTYAMNKHRANETIYDVMLRGTNVPMVDENYASKPAGHEFTFPDLPAGTYYPMKRKIPVHRITLKQRV